MVLSAHYLGHRSNVNDDYRPIQEVCVALAGFELSARIWQCLGDSELNHQRIAYLWLLCFDKDIFAYNLTTKVKLKILLV